MRVAIAADGTVRVRTGKVELGQGLHLALAQIVADELGMPVEQVQMLPVDTASSPDEGVTAGSLSVQDAGRALREACAALRPRAAVRRVVGQSLPRPELERLFAGRPYFIHDLELDGQLHGRVLHPPQVGARVLAWDEAAARSGSGDGLVHLQRDGALFGLIAERSAQADAAFERLAGAVSWQAVDPVPDDALAWMQQPATTRLVVDRHAPVAVARTLRATPSRG